MKRKPRAHLGSFHTWRDSWDDDFCFVRSHPMTNSKTARFEALRRGFVGFEGLSGIDIAPVSEELAVCDQKNLHLF